MSPSASWMPFCEIVLTCTAGASPPERMFVKPPSFDGYCRMPAAWKALPCARVRKTRDERADCLSAEKATGRKDDKALDIIVEGGERWWRCTKESRARPHTRRARSHSSERLHTLASNHLLRYGCQRRGRPEHPLNTQSTCRWSVHAGQKASGGGAREETRGYPEGALRSDRAGCSYPRCPVREAEAQAEAEYWRGREGQMVRYPTRLTPSRRCSLEFLSCAGNGVLSGMGHVRTA